MNDLLKIIFSLPKKYIVFSIIVVLIAVLMSFSEVFVLSSIKPFIQSFSILSKDGGVDISEVLKSSKSFFITILICGGIRIFLIFFQYRIAALVSAKISSNAFKKIINQDYLSLKSANQSKFLSILVQDIPRTSESISNLDVYKKK